MKVLHQVYLPVKLDNFLKKVLSRLLQITSALQLFC